MVATTVVEFDPAAHDYREAHCTKALVEFLREQGVDWDDHYPFFINAAAEMNWQWKHPFPFAKGQRVRLREGHRMGVVTDITCDGSNVWDCGDVRVRWDDGDRRFWTSANSLEKVE